MDTIEPLGRELKLNKVNRIRVQRPRNNYTIPQDEETKISETAGRLKVGKKRHASRLDASQWSERK